MERKGLLLALGAVALIAAGVVVWWNDQAARGTADDDGATVAAGHASHAGRIGGGDGERATTTRGAPAIDADAGVLARVPRLGAPRTAGARAGNDEELPGNASDVERSSGWRLGQTRRRMAILEPRIERLRGIVADLEARGETALAERQRAVLERTERRMGELREEADELGATAQRDGTLGEVDRGYEEGESDANAERGAVNARMPERSTE